MYWRRLVTALALGTVAITAVTGPTVAAPITDESTTSIDISSATITPLGDQTFTVTIERIDDLRDDNGGLIAERQIDIQLSFEVADDAVLVNGVPVDFGVSTVDVKSSIHLGNVAERAGITEEEVAPAFDIGLARLKIRAQAEKLLINASELVDLQDNLQQTGEVSEEMAHEIEEAIEEGGMLEVRRVIVAARILEINGQNVVQSDVVEQIFDITPVGSVHHGQPKTLPMTVGPVYFAGVFDADELAQQAYDMPCHGGMHHPMGQQMKALWNRLSMPVRVSISIFGATVFLLTLFVALPYAMYVHRRTRRDPAYQALGRDNDDDDGESQLDFDVDEKKTGGLTDPQMMENVVVVDPPAYTEEDETTKLVTSNTTGQ